MEKRTRNMRSIKKSRRRMNRQKMRLPLCKGKQPASKSVTQLCILICRESQLAFVVVESKCVVFSFYN